MRRVCEPPEADYAARTRRPDPVSFCHPTPDGVGWQSRPLSLHAELPQAGPHPRGTRPSTVAAEPLRVVFHDWRGWRRSYQEDWACGMDFVFEPSSETLP